ncbi:MAG: low molecular weight phosphotyrosine protein phosphatase [Lachnospiraceae bacterium]|nr:low molecular weight phosphotyrosine protein phosphatase [Lachnospiraceae bacterium]
MIKILFICHGNICRSPMAEFILKDIVKKRGIANDFYIASAATSTEEIWGERGNPVYPSARKKLQEHGIACSGKYAVQLKREDYNRYDYLLCMDDANVRNSLRILGGDPEKKVKRLLYYGRQERNIADPWYTGNFDDTYEDLQEGLEGLLKYLGY